MRLAAIFSVLLLARVVKSLGDSEKPARKPFPPVGSTITDEHTTTRDQAAGDDAAPSTATNPNSLSLPPSGLMPPENIMLVQPSSESSARSDDAQTELVPSSYRLRAEQSGAAWTAEDALVTGGAEINDTNNEVLARQMDPELSDEGRHAEIMEDIADLFEQLDYESDIDFNLDVELPLLLVMDEPDAAAELIEEIEVSVHRRRYHILMKHVAKTYGIL